jgi:hypothetical protein
MLRRSTATAWITSRSPKALACKAIRVTEPDGIQPAFEQARAWMMEHRIPVIVEVILERVTNIAMGTEIDKVVEFEELAEDKAHAPTPSLCSTNTDWGGSHAQVLRQLDHALQRAWLS